MTQGSRPGRSTPPSATGLLHALDRLGRRGSAEAALHLALPRDEVPSMAVRMRHDGWHWRGLRVAQHPAPERPAALLAALGWRPGDRFLDLQRDPIDWVKPMRSGSGWYAFGLDTLLGLPLLRLPGSASREQVLRACRDLSAGRLGLGSRLLGGVVEQGIGCWQVAEQPAPSPGVDAAQSMAACLGGLLVDLPGSVGVRLPCGRLLAVPCHWHAEALSLRPFDCQDLPVPADAGPAPAGFAYAGLTGSGALVVQHEGTGLRGLLM